MKVFTKLALVAVLCVACFVAGYLSNPYVRPPRHIRKQTNQNTTFRAGRGLFVKDGGFWHRRKDVRDAGQDDLSNLHSLPYVTGSQSPPPSSGVTVYDQARSAGGCNLYSSAHAPRAFLIDATGRVLHEWHMDRDKVWPELAGSDKDKARQYFRRIRLLENGDLLAIYEYTGLIRLDAHSNLLWAYQGWNHHDFDLDEKGQIHVLGRDTDEKGEATLEDREKPLLPREVAGKRVYDENITVLSPEGVVQEKISLIDCIENSRFAPLLDVIQYDDRHEPIDLLHPNTVQVLDGHCAHISPIFKKGNILISFRNISTISIIDPEDKRVVWALSHGWRWQHDPCLLPNGLMLLFDNFADTASGEIKEERSRVIEFDPLTQQVTWSYDDADGSRLFSSLMGANQRLPNGNTLITESDFGRAVEVTRAGQIVWEFNNPHRTGENDELVAVIPEMARLAPDFPRDFAAEPPE